MDPITITRDATVSVPAAQVNAQLAQPSANVEAPSAVAAKVFGPDGEVVADQSTVEGILGLDRVNTTRHNDPTIKMVLEGTEAEAMQKELAELRDENQFMKSERGRYGREVVGPMRDELETLRGQVGQLMEAPAQQPAAPPAPQPASTEDIARSLFGADADVTDPAVLRAAQASEATFNAVQQSVQASLKPLTDAVTAIASRVDAQSIAADSGITQQDVQKVVAKVPALAKLPYEDQVSAIRDLRKAGDGQPAPTARDGQGRFTAEAHQSPAEYVEGGSAVFSDPIEGGAEAAAAQFDRYKGLGRKGGPGAAAMQNVFLEQLNRGAFS